MIPDRCLALALLIGSAAILPASAQQAAPKSSAAAAATGAAPADAEKIITAHGISMFGPPKMPADFQHLAYVNPDAPKGGELSQYGIGGFDSYNPFTFRGRATAPSVLMLERLMEDVLDDPLASYCLLCSTIEYPESRDWVIFNLRPEAKFSDGTPLTADDVLFSFELLRDKGFSSYRTAIQQMVKGVEVLDPQRIKFTFSADYPRRDVISQVGAQVVFSKKDFEANKRDIEQTSNLPFVGSGPYVFDKADFGRSITMKRDPNYWGRDLPINKGRYNFDRLRFEYFADYDAAFEAFKAGVYTFRIEASEQHWATRYDFPAFKAGDVVKETLPDGSIASGGTWVFNLGREKFQDARVREAIGLMFNFEWSNEALFYGLNRRLTSLWDNTDLKADGKPSEAELALLKPLEADLPAGVLTEDAVLPPTSGKQQLDRRNLRRATALLDEAGWTTGNDGLRRNAKGETLKVELLNHNQSLDRIINPFISNLRQLGVDAVYTRIDPSELTTRARSKDFDMVADSLDVSYAIGGGTEQVFGSADADDVFNPMGLRNKAVDSLIAQGIRASSEEETRDIIRALDRVLRALRIGVPQWYKPDYLVAYYNMYRHPDKLPPLALGVTDFWWIDAEAEKALKQKGALR